MFFSMWTESSSNLKQPQIGGLDWWGFEPWFFLRANGKASLTAKPPIQTTRAADKPAVSFGTLLVLGQRRGRQIFLTQLERGFQVSVLWAESFGPKLLGRRG